MEPNSSKGSIRRDRRGGPRGWGAAVADIPGIINIWDTNKTKFGGAALRPTA